ncbi:hypothetical protein NEDG_00215 [Nematocida displodere]|uniref:Uncharacterized protein n=1 Tax=Nematocida displodere TaxID=1805483 RepID=A0A177EK40_9MICR|nr:hypothetical protein NEDG_00215 [Nematocida displodere]
MDGETYNSIGTSATSLLEGRYHLNFVHGRSTEESLFVVYVDKRMTRSKYHVHDASGRGILDVTDVSPEAKQRIVEELKVARVKGTMVRQKVQVVGRLSENNQSHTSPVVTATSLSLFTFHSALCHLLGRTTT